MELTEYYYTYYSYEEWGMGYIGSRGCKCLPEEDINYFGSFKDKAFKPTQKIILKDDYATREEAYADEIILQGYYSVVENQHFVNRAYQTSTKFSIKGLSSWSKGKKFTEEHRKKISESTKGKSKTITEKRKNSTIIRAKARTGKPGHKHSEETKRKISEATQGRVPWNKGIKNINTSGGKNPRAKKIYYDGKIYDCILNAIEITGKSYYCIKKYGTIVT
jgi:hypothetical protein